MKIRETAKTLVFDEIEIGQAASFEKLITQDDVLKFADLSGDYNPLHLDEGYAGNTELRGSIIHGMILAALVSRLIGMELPGRKSLILKESLEFKKPARVGDTVLVSGNVINKSYSTNIIDVEVKIFNLKKLLVSGLVRVKILK